MLALLQLVAAAAEDPLLCPSCAPMTQQAPARFQVEFHTVRPPSPRIVITLIPSSSYVVVVVDLVVVVIGGVHAYGAENRSVRV